MKKNPLTGISPKQIDLKNANLLFICSPVWGMKFAPAITTFMNTADFKGKKVVLFAVAAGRMKQASLDEYSALIKNKGGEVMGTCIVKTIFKTPDEIKEEVKKILAANKGAWVKK